MKTNYMISGYGLRENQGTTYGCVFFGLFRSMAVWVRKAREASRHCRGTMAALCQHSRSILVVLCLFVGVCGAWGETYNMTPNTTTTNNTSNSYVTSNHSFTSNGIGWTINQWNPTSLQIKTNQSTTSEFYFYNTTAFSGNITSVVLTFSALTLSNTSASSWYLSQGTSQVGTSSLTTTGAVQGVWNATAKTLTFTVTGNCTYFTIWQNGKVATGTNKLAESNAISVTYSAGAAVAYTVTFDAGGGSCDTPSSTEASAGAGVTLPTASPSDACTAAGWTFAGWATATCAETPDAPTLYAADENYKLTNDCTLYAVYSKTEGGGDLVYGWEDTEPNASSFTTTFLNTNTSITAHTGSKYGANINSSGSGVAGNGCAITTTSKVGATAVEFYYSKTSTNTTTVNWVLKTSTDGTNWTDNATTFSASDATKGEWSKASWTLDGTKVYIKITMSANNNAIRTIDDLKISCGTTTYNSNPSCAAATQCATPTFSLAAGTYDTGAQSVTLSCSTDVATIYYTTDGTTPTGSSTAYTAPINVDRDMTIRAIAIKGGLDNSEVAAATYVITYPVTFNLNGKDGAVPTTQNISYNGNVTEPTAPEVTGYTLAGWYTEAGCTNEWNFASNQVTSTTTLYAKWTATEYSITYEDLNGAANTNPATYTIETATIALQDAGERSGYRFAGWFTEAGGAGTQVTEIAHGSTGDKVVYAKWIAVYSITWLVNGVEQELEPRTVEEGTALGSLPAPDMGGICDGRAFVCWTTNASYHHATDAPTGTDLVQTTTTPTGDVTYYAVFATSEGGDGKWGRATSAGDLVAGRKIIIGYEQTANSGIIVPARNENLHANNYIITGTTAGSSGSGTITMLPTFDGTDYEYTLCAGQNTGYFALKNANDEYIGHNGRNSVKVYGAINVDGKTDFSFVFSANDVVTIKNKWGTENITTYKNEEHHYNLLRYNTTSNQERFAIYETNMQDPVLYYKIAVTYSDYTTSCSCTEGVVSVYNANADGKSGDICLSQVGETTAYTSVTVKLPSTANEEDNNFWASVGSGAWTNDKSANKKFSELYLADTRLSKNVVAQAGIYGKWVAYSDNQNADANFGVGFLPDWQITYGVEGSGSWQKVNFAETATQYKYETAMLTSEQLTALKTANTKFYVGARTDGNTAFLKDYSTSDYSSTQLLTATYLDNDVNTPYLRGGDKVLNADGGKFSIWSNSGQYNAWPTFIPYYCVKYDMNGGTGSMANSELAETSVSVAACGFTRDGYAFVGWATSPEDEVVYQAGDTYTFGLASHNATNTLYAKWAASYTVTWSVGGETSTTPVVEGGTAILPMPEACANNRIVGWTTNSDFAGVQDAAPADMITANPTITGNITYYAVYERDDVKKYSLKCIYKVEFYSDGAVFETQYVQAGTNAQNPATANPSRMPTICDGFSLAANTAWVTTPVATPTTTVPTYRNFNTKVNEDLSLYAVYTYTDAGGGSGSSDGVDDPIAAGGDVSGAVPSATEQTFLVTFKNSAGKYYALNYKDGTDPVLSTSDGAKAGTDVTSSLTDGTCGKYLANKDNLTGFQWKVIKEGDYYRIYSGVWNLAISNNNFSKSSASPAVDAALWSMEKVCSNGAWKITNKSVDKKLCVNTSSSPYTKFTVYDAGTTNTSYYNIELIPVSDGTIIKTQDMADGTAVCDAGPTRYYTTSPNCAPSITITGQVNVTAAKGQQAQAVKRFTVTANNLDKYTKVDGAKEPHYLRAFLGTNGSHFTLAWVEADGSVSETGSAGGAVNTCSLSIGDSTTWRKQLAVFYTPDAEAEDDLQETVTITVYATSNNGSTLGSDGNKCAEAETTATGRALPSRFAIVATSTDGNTYALPNNMSTAATYSGMQVTITDGVVVNPPAEAVYTAQQVFGSGIDGSSDIGNIRAQERYILLRGEGDENKALWNGNGNTLKNDTKALNTVWQLQTEDLIDYKIISYTTSNSNLSLNVANGATKPYNYFGAYSLTDNGNLPTDKRKVRIVPIVDDPECHHYQPVIVTESSADGAITHEKITLNVSIANGGSQYSLTDYRYSLDEGATWTAVTASPVVIEGLTPETEYHVIFAGANNCTIAGEITVSTTEDLTPCENAPNNLRATVSPTTAHIEWGAHGNADGTTYYITLYEDPYLRKPIDGSAQSTTNTEYDYEDLSAGTEYWYQIYVMIDEMPCKSEVRSFITNNDAFDIVEWQTDGIIIEPWIDITGLTVETGQQEMVLIGDESDEVADELFFSKYFEAQSNVKMLGLYNGTNAAIDLSQYTIKITNESASTKSGEAEWSTTQSFAISAEIAAYNKLNCGEARSTTLQPGEELILITYTKPKGESFCSNTATVADQKIIDCAVDNPNSGWEKYIKTTKLNFSGNDAVGLFKNGELIDIIGAHHNNGATGYLGENNAHGVIAKQDFMDDPGWYTANGDNISTSVVEDNYALSTNRCLLIRKKDVKSGAKAVAANTADFVTLGGGTVGETTYANEWAGLQIPDGPDANKYINSCEGFNYVGEFNYKEYYTHYVSIGKPATDWAGMSRGDGTYKVAISNLETMSCNNIRVRLINGTDPETSEPIVVASQEAKVPIMITADMTTAGGEVADAAEFVQHKENYYSAKLGADNTLAGKEHAVCKECDVVILNGATLQITNSASQLTGVVADGKNITLQARDVEVYTGGRLILDNHVLFNSLTIRALEDNVATANLQAFLHLTDDDGLHHEKRVRGTRWYFFSLPYDCYINDVTFRNGTQATYGTDWVLKYFDGQARANWSAEGKVVLASTKFWKVYEPADGILRAGQGYILGVETNNGTDTHKYRELHFPMAMANYITDAAVELNQYYPNADEDDPNTNGNMAKQLTVNAWGARREQRDTGTQWEQGTNNDVVRPNNVGWNLIGVPFTDMYVPTKGISGMNATAGIYTDITIDKDATNPEHDEVNPVLVTYIAEGENLIPTSTNIEHVVYAEYDNETGKMIQYQQRSTDITAAGTPDRYIMKPFLSYFVQVPGRAVAEFNANGEVTKSGDVATVENLETDKAFVLQFEPAGTTGYISSDPSSARRRSIYAEQHLTAADLKQVYLALCLTNDKAESDYTTLRLNNRFKDGYEVGRDLVKMRGDAYTRFTLPVLASQLKGGDMAGDDMAFQYLPDSSVVNLPLTYWAAKAGQMTISLSQHSDINYLDHVYLFDNQENIYTDLTQTDYTFTTEAGNHTTRFYLTAEVNRTSQEIVVDGVVQDAVPGIHASADNSQITLCGVPNGAKVWIYSAEGKLCHSAPVNAPTCQFTMPAAGVYYVRIETFNSKQTLPVVVK